MSYTPGRLIVRWDKRRKDMLYDYPDGEKQTGSMVHFAVSHLNVIDGKTLRQELTARGYDIATLRIQIDKLKP